MQIPELIIQTNLQSDWEKVEEKIGQSKIFRIPYKRLLGESLTKYILQLRKDGLNSTQAFIHLVRLETIKKYINDNILIQEKIMENIQTSISARYSEESSRGR